MPDTDSSSQFIVPEYPVTFDWVVSLAMTGRAPWKPFADCLSSGDPLILKRDPHNPHDPRAVAVLDAKGNPVGYLYALEAGLLYLLFDNFPPLADGSTVDAIIPPGNSRRSPIVRVRMHLELESAAPLFVLIALLELKGESFPRRFDFSRNPWLKPLLQLHQSYRQNPDEFHLPQGLVDFWQHHFAFN